MAHQPPGHHVPGQCPGLGAGRRRQDRRGRPVPQPSRGGRARRAARRGTGRVLGHAAEAEPRAVRPGPQRRTPGAAAGGPAAPGCRQLQRRTPRRRLAHGMAGPPRSCSAWPSALPATSGNWPKACRFSRTPCAATWTSPDRCCWPKAWAPPWHRCWTTRTAATGKQQLQAVVDRTLQVPAAEQAATYRRLLREAVPAGRLTDLRLEELLDPASYLGQAAEISRRILAAFPDFRVPQHPTRQHPTTRTEPTVAKPTLKAVLLSPQRPLGDRPLLRGGTVPGHVLPPVDRGGNTARHRLRRGGLGPARPRRLAGGHRRL